MLALWCSAAYNLVFVFWRAMTSKSLKGFAFSKKRIIAIITVSCVGLGLLLLVASVKNVSAFF